VFFRSIKGFIDTYVSSPSWKAYSVVSQAVISLYVLNTLNSIIFGGDRYDKLTPHETDRIWNSYYVGYLSVSQRGQETVVRNALAYLHTICPFCGERGGTMEFCSQLANCTKKRVDKPLTLQSEDKGEFKVYLAKLKKAKEAHATGASGTPFDQKKFDELNRPTAKPRKPSTVKDISYYCSHQDELTLRKMEDYSSLMKPDSN
jgi:hypothetical protein